MIGSSQDLGQGDESPGVLRGTTDEFGDLGGHPLPLGHVGLLGELLQHGRVAHRLTGQ